jgi:hypothetical protein
MQKMCKDSLLRCSKDVAIFDDVDALETRSSAILLDRVKDPSVCLHLIVGSSGVGTIADRKKLTQRTQ